MSDEIRGILEQLWTRGYKDRTSNEVDESISQALSAIREVIPGMVELDPQKTREAIGKFELKYWEETGHNLPITDLASALCSQGEKIVKVRG